MFDGAFVQMIEHLIAGDTSLARDIGQALEQLPEDQRHVVLLIGLEDLAYADAAEVLDIPLGTVMSRLNRGRRRLREIMEPEEPHTLRSVK